MAYDEGSAELMREALAQLDGIREQKMFGGLCFLWKGNMLCGIHTDNALFRVGKDNAARALALPNTQPMQLTGRKMGGMVELDAHALGDPVFDDLMALAQEFVGALPPK
jgi:TfoX/Sxy family transcriptional regulator of competence genes